MIKSYEQIAEIVTSKDKNVQIVDARPPNSFNGFVENFPKKLFDEFFFSRSAPTAGHIRGTLNVPYSSLFDGSKQTLKSIDELRESSFSFQRWKFFKILNEKFFHQKVFEKNGVDLKKPTIYTCQTGTTASALAFVGHLLGQSSTPVYNVSFRQVEFREKNRAPNSLCIAISRCDAQLNSNVR